MNILWNPQLSTVSKETKQFELLRDSNFIFFMNLVRALNKNNNNYEFRVPVPWIKDDDAYNEINVFKNVKLKLVPDMFVQTPFSSRCHWDLRSVHYLLENYVPDIIFENNPTLVLNWKILLHELGMMHTKIVSYNHWIDSLEYRKVPEDITYSIRQAEGAMLSDLHLCNSQEALDQIQNNLYRIGYSFTDNINVLQPIINEEEFVVEDKTVNEKKIIVYNHRLSSHEYYDDALKFFCSIIQYLSNFQLFRDNVDKVVFTDASKKLSSIFELPLVCTDRVKIELANNLNREEYAELLKKSDICVATFKNNNGGCWSMSLAESILAKNAVIVPYHSGYKEMVPEGFYWKTTGEHDKEDFDKFHKLLLGLVVDDASIRFNSKFAYDNYIKKYHSSILIDKFSNYMKEVHNA